jgi:hypothetical protein
MSAEAEVGYYPFGGIAPPLAMWRFSDLGALELYCLVVDRFSVFSDDDR